MLAARDQENLVQGHLQAAASKPLNQGTRQAPPKTPGNKVPKTPFRIPLNDENGPGAFGGGKTGLKANAKGNENFATVGKRGILGDKDAFKTPLGPRNRAPLGAKTTNAKAKSFHIPPPPSVEDVQDKSPRKSVSARKSRPRVSHAEMTKLDIFGDIDELREREIEYMPPPPKNLPDYPDDIHESNLTPFPNGEGLAEAIAYQVYHEPGPDGLSHVQREEMKRKKKEELEEKEMLAQMVLETDILMSACVHSPECPEGSCTFEKESRKKAEAKYRKTMEEIYPERKPTATVPPSTRPSPTKPAPKKPISSKGPSTLTSKTAATALSQQGNPKPTKPAVKALIIPPTKSRLPFSNITSRKQTPPPTNPSEMRHTAATLASKTTIGRSAGRSVSATLRKTSAPNTSKTTTRTLPDTSLPPALYIQRYGEPERGSEMWNRCRDAGCIDDDDDDDQEDLFGVKAFDFDGFLREDAEREFEFKL